MMDIVVGGKFKLGRKLGIGAFGELYLGMHFIYQFFKLFLIVVCFL